MTYRRTTSQTVVVEARPEEVFQVLDDPKALGAHMERPSVMMLGATMRYDLDEAGGRAVGSVIRMTGSVLGIGLHLEAVVTERMPSLRKAWQTRGPVRLLVIGAYRMGFRIESLGSGCKVKVQIEYDLPNGVPGRFLGRVFGESYARWCVSRMAAEVNALDSRLSTTASSPPGKANLSAVATEKAMDGSDTAT